MSVEIRATALCDDCEADAQHAFCDGCLDEEREKAQASALIGYVPEDDAAQEARDNVAQYVRDWLTKERLKPASDITPDAIRIIERMAEDLEAGG